MSSKHYWYMYCRGRQTALTKGHVPAGSGHLSEFFTGDQCSGCAELVARTSIMLVGYVKYNINVDTRVYRTCTGTVIECRHPGGVYDYFSIDLDDAEPTTSRRGVRYAVHALGESRYQY